MSMRTVIGLDAGGTKTAAVLVSEAGRVLGRGEGGSGNTNFIPVETARASFAQAIGGAREAAGVERLDVSLAVVGTEPDPEPVADTILSLTGTSRLIHVKEGECSLVGGLVRRTGVALICGTGSVGFGRNESGETWMTSCWGPIGDEGSAYDLARRGVNAAFHAWDGRGPTTVLVEKLLEMFDVADLRDACTPLYTSENLRKDFASLARLVTDAAAEGDAVALGVMEEGAREVARFLTVCAGKLGLGERYEVAAPMNELVGTRESVYFRLIQEALAARHPGARLTEPRFPPVVGAALIALDELGILLSEDLTRRLAETLPTGST